MMRDRKSKRMGPNTPVKNTDKNTTPVKNYVIPQGYIRVSSTGSAHVVKDIRNHLNLDEKQEWEIPWLSEKSLVVLYDENASGQEIMYAMRRLITRIEGAYETHVSDEFEDSLFERIREYVVAGRIDLVKEALGIQ